MYKSLSLYILTFSWGTKINLFYICFLLSCISFVFCFRVCKSIPLQFFSFSVWNSNVGCGWWGPFFRLAERRQGFKCPLFYFFRKNYCPSNRKTKSWNVLHYLIRFKLFNLTMIFVRYMYRLIYPWMNNAQ